ncbi:MAG TPA: hydrogenase maturation protease [Pyrinomonadaceae bacterium]|nr:hydrogenase maturation protease [Pyrinomonadaceae bacterium]
MMNLKSNKSKVLILGIGNILMGDEGIGVAVVRALEKTVLPESVECLDGGTGGFVLLEPMQNAERVILIDATIDGAKTGTVRRLRPRFSTDYPRTLTAHDIGLKDLLDTFYLLGDTPDVTLFAVSIPPLQDLKTGLSNELLPVVPQVAKMVLEEASIIPA